jgi:hypothetical protein
MHIFSKYRQVESKTEFKLLRGVIDGVNLHTLDISEAIDLLYKIILDSDYKYIRCMACCLSLNLKKNLLSEVKLRNIVEALKSYLSRSKLGNDCSLRREIEGILLRYGFNGKCAMPIKQLNFDKMEKGFYYYEPVKSGFFSIIENIINAEIYAKSKGRNIILVNEEKWWPYSEKFSIIFNGCFEFSQSTNFRMPYINEITFRQHRRWMFSMAYSNWSEYNEIKKRIYARIYSSLLAYNLVIGNQVADTSDMFAVYIRRGDKISLEDISIPTNLIYETLEKVCYNFNALYLVSDDMPWLKSNFKNIHDNVIFDDSSSSGYFFGNESAFDHADIIRKYIQLIQAKNFSGDTGSNLVNAIGFSRASIGKESISTNILFTTDIIPLF